MDAYAQESFNLITSLRSDVVVCNLPESWGFGAKRKTPSQFYMLRWHRDRLVEAARFFQRESDCIEDPSGLQLLEEKLQEHLLDKYHDPFYPHPLKVSLNLPIPAVFWGKPFQRPHELANRCIQFLLFDTHLVSRDRCVWSSTPTKP